MDPETLAKKLKGLHLTDYKVEEADFDTTWPGVDRCGNLTGEVYDANDPDLWPEHAKMVEWDTAHKRLVAGEQAIYLDTIPDDLVVPPIEDDPFWHGWYPQLEAGMDVTLERQEALFAATNRLTREAVAKDYPLSSISVCSDHQIQTEVATNQIGRDWQRPGDEDVDHLADEDNDNEDGGGVMSGYWETASEAAWAEVFPGVPFEPVREAVAEPEGRTGD